MAAVVVGLPEARRAFASLAAQAPQMAERSIRAGGAELGRVMEAGAPRLSDDMRDSVAKSIVTRDAGRQAVLVGTSHPIAALWEFGGELTPTRSEFLVFEGSGGTVFTRSATFPARPFLRPAVDSSRSAMAQAAKRSAQRSVRQRAR